MEIKRVIDDDDEHLDNWATHTCSNMCHIASINPQSKVSFDFLGVTSFKKVNMFSPNSFFFFSLLSCPYFPIFCEIKKNKEITFDANKGEQNVPSALA